MGILSALEPKEPLKFFEELCAIPHGSKNTKAISDYCVRFAEERGLDVIQDSYNNIIITKEATPGYEDEDAIIIQGHLDMVCEKVLGSDFDFETDGLVLETDEEWIWAKDTSLGGDDGIAVAMALAVLDSTELCHPKVEVVFTVDEEIGLIGAKDIDLSSLTGKKMINIDAEDDSQVLTSCAGGTFLEGSIPLTYIPYTGMEYVVEIKGLLGGHSGAEIHKERGNSNLLMGRILHALRNNIEISDVYGGNADNVIPGHTTAIIMFEEEKTKQVLSELQKVESEIKNEYLLSDSNVHVVLTKNGIKDGRIVEAQSKLILKNVLMNLPNGIQTMSSAIPGLVETSQNMGICKIENDTVIINYNVRSSKETAKRYLVDRTIAMIEMMGGSVEEKGDYPGWEYRVDSPLRDIVVKVYTNSFGKDPIIGAVHAGLECGLFGEKISDLDCVSIGPNLIDIHSYNEKMEVASVGRIWNLLTGVLKSK